MRMGKAPIRSRAITGGELHLPRRGWTPLSKARGVQVKATAFMLRAVTCCIVAGASALLAPAESLSEALVYNIKDNADDGTEVNSIWYDTGYASWCNTVGRSFSKHFIAGMRFHLADLEQGQIVKYARL